MRCEIFIVISSSYSSRKYPIIKNIIDGSIRNAKLIFIYLISAIVSSSSSQSNIVYNYNVVKVSEKWAKTITIYMIHHVSSSRSIIVETRQTWIRLIQLIKQPIPTATAI